MNYYDDLKKQAGICYKREEKREWERFKGRLYYAYKKGRIDRPRYDELRRLANGGLALIWLGKYDWDEAAKRQQARLEKGIQ